MQNKKLTKSKYPIDYGANKNIQKKAKELRNNETPSEKLLWDKLKNKQLAGFKFRRQHSLKQFIADFYCHKAKLIIELDGEIHNTVQQKERDEGRSYEIEQAGLTVLRFTNDEVKNEIDNVLEKIKTELMALNP
jgi:very-short-patch-repair endonuclease